ncbi:dTDP-4-keto-6-deoxy-D-glucose epimerase [Heliobacillus mobilis]|uniref:dTDP-4-keto-6-deoxy-D-glucose epimerase n=1 Tax=Heliobacterium mobile TaxID=28064 RepID=A0A6I3SMW8_HELMO|nr:dTDP-4-dehydrorhamnose 3,5-epimerase family protein [Heliobacterium mobile]MTV49677.1 dTDP-4-keto-6-deoxy-D-glucose epimerase [Heliobacterium mobile]
MLAVEKTKLDGVLLIKPYTFEDFRGTYTETYNEKLYKENGIDIDFVQDDISVSSQGVLRGIHGDQNTWKLISCLHGKFYFVVVNCDEQSINFGKWQAFTLSASNYHQVLVPPKHGNAHLVLSEQAIFHYKQSTYYDPAGQFTYKWNDPKLNIWWPIKDPILSQRDEVGHRV